MGIVVTVANLALIQAVTSSSLLFPSKINFMNLIYVLAFFILLFVLTRRNKEKRISPQRMNELVDRMNRDTQEFYQKYNQK